MRFAAEYRDPKLALSLARQIRRRVTRRWRVMEVCGGQTHAIVKHGLTQLLPEGLEVVHGPGCPVCVTPASWIDSAIELANTPGVTLCSYGDMLRVPGSDQSLLGARARGARVQLVPSPLQALERAAADRSRQVVFFAVGFETTAPATALALRMAQQRKLSNFTVLCAHVRVCPALQQLLSRPECAVDGLLAAGHVCTVMGLEDHEALARRLHMPIVAAGFEPVDLLHGLGLLVEQLESGRTQVLNAYGRAVTAEGNRVAQQALREVFVPRRFEWRGIGVLEASGYRLSEAFSEHDAERRFSPAAPSAGREPGPSCDSCSPVACIAGQVLMGEKRPPECASFGRGCTPEHPRGAPMVSSEGACAAYFRHVRRGGAAAPSEVVELRRVSTAPPEVCS